MIMIVHWVFCADWLDGMTIIMIMIICTGYTYFVQTGWMMWNWLVSALAVGATVILYDGSPFIPSPNVLWDTVDSLGYGLYSTQYIRATGSLPLGYGLYRAYQLVFYSVLCILLIRATACTLLSIELVSLGYSLYSQYSIC